MPGRTFIESHKGIPLKINGEGEISVTLHPHPPIEEGATSLPYRKYFTSSGGSNDMRVNGSSTNVDFNISAEQDRSVWIKSISIKLSDPGAKFNLFGALAALSNGVEFSWFTQTKGKQVIHEGIVDNLEFFRLSDQAPTITDLTGGGEDAVIVHIDLSKLFGTQHGLRINKGTTDRLTFRIQDNLSAGLSEFNIIGYGISIEHT